MSIILKKKAAATIDTPATDKVTLFVESDGTVQTKDDAGAVSVMASEDYVDTSISTSISNIIPKTYTLGENIASAGIVSMLPDGKIYDVNSNKRLVNQSITGHTATKSALLPNNKIITIGLTSSTLTAYVGTIDYAANTISYGSGVQVATNCAGGIFYVCKAGTDLAVVSYGNSNGTGSSSNGYCKARGISISGTTPSIGSEVDIAGPSSTYGSTASYSAYVREGVVGIGYFSQYNGGSSCSVMICSISGNTLTLGTAAGGGSGADTCEILDVQYVTDNLLAINYHYGSNATYLQLISVSGITPTAGGAATIANVGMGSGTKLCTNGTAIYTIGYVSSGAVYSIRKFTYSGTTLSATYTSTGNVGQSSGICLNGDMIGLVQSTNILWYSDIGTDIALRNTINYGVALTQLYENSYSTNYHIITVSGNPSYIYKLSNEDRRTIGYLTIAGNKDDVKTIYIDGEVITGLTGIIPGAIYYVTTTGAMGFGGNYVFARGLTTTSIKINLNIT